MGGSIGKTRPCFSISAGTGSRSNSSPYSAASAVNAAFRQVGAVLGTAILVAIVGEPASLPQALSASDDAYMFAVWASLASGAAVLGLRGSPRGARSAGFAEPHAEALD